MVGSPRRPGSVTFAVGAAISRSYTPTFDATAASSTVWVLDDFAHTR